MRRRGLTLIELLVVIGIITFVAGLVVLLGPGLVKGDRVAKGAGKLQGDLFIAKHMALKNRASAGIRLLRASPNPQDPEYHRVRSYQFITRDTDYHKGKVVAEAGKTEWATVVGADITGGHKDMSLWHVKRGDLLQVQAYQAVRITAVYPDGTLECNAPVVPGNPKTVPLDTTDYRIFRAARPDPGQAVVELPAGVIVDLRPGRSEVVVDETTGELDVLFTPQGRVLGQRGRVVLWVRNEDAAPDSAEQALIVVWVANGSVASVPVDTSTTNPTEQKRLLNDQQAHGGM